MGLGNYINSNYISAANALNGKHSRRKIIAYVESYDDVFFWRSILAPLENDSRYFQVTLPSRGKKLERGKKAVLMSAFKDSVGPNMIACVDADYDYLKQGCNKMSEDVCKNPYVFHTYAYAIENLQCWAPSLHEVCVMATLVDSDQLMDFEEFLSRYSEIIYPLFVWNILSARNNALLNFDINDFLSVINTGVVVKRFANDTLKRVEEHVNKKLRQIETHTSTKARETYKSLYLELQQLGVNPKETYLYIQGHTLFDNLVVPMLTRCCDHLVQEREEEIGRQSKHNTQERNEISCYEHSIETISAMLKKNTLYLHSTQVEKIIADLKKNLG